MSAPMGGKRRRGRRAWIIAGLVAVAGVLAGCSGSGAMSDSAGSDAAYGGDAGYVDSAAEEGTVDGTTVTTTDRSIIITGEMYMTVEDPVAAADQATSIVETAGGRIDARSETAADEYYGGDASLTLRIPTDGLDAVLEDLRGLGTVDQLSTQSSDVTTEVTDLDAKISTLRASTARIEGLLADAQDIKDIIALEDELASRQAELQSLEAQQRGLADQVSLSTIYLSLTTEPVVVVDDSPRTFWDGLVDGWNSLMTFFSVALVVLGVLLPWLALGALIALGVVAVVRGNRARKAGRASVGPQPAAAPMPGQAQDPAQGQPPAPPSPPAP